MWAAVAELEKDVYTGFHGHHYNAVDAGGCEEIGALKGVLARHAFVWVPLSFNSAFTSKMEQSSALVQRRVEPLVRVHASRDSLGMRLELRSPDVQADTQRIAAGMALFQCLIWRWRREQHTHTLEWLDNDTEADANMQAVLRKGRAARVTYGGSKKVAYADVVARLVDEVRYEAGQLGVTADVERCALMAREGGSEGEQDIVAAQAMFGMDDAAILRALVERAMARYRQATTEGMLARGMPLPKALSDFER